MDTNVNILQLLEKLKKTIIEPQKKLWDEMEDETGMNKIEESNVIHMSIYRYKQEELMKKFIEKFLVDNNYYDLYRIAKVFVKFPKSYIERNLGVSLTDIKYEEFKQDLSDLVRLGDEALQEDASAVANGGGASAQLGTAPTPSLGQVTVNGKPWTSGKSYKAKKKKKIKETADSTVFIIEYRNENDEHKAITSDIDGLNQIIDYPSKITIDNFYDIIDTLLTNRSLFNSPSNFNGTVVAFKHQNYRDIDAEDVAGAISFFNAIASESDTMFDDSEETYDFWTYSSGITRKLYKYPSVLEYQGRQPAQFSFYYNIIYNAQSDGSLMKSAIDKVYPEIANKIAQAREEERLHKEQEQKEKDANDKVYQKALKEFKKIKTAYDFCNFLGKYGGKAYIDGYANVYVDSDTQKLVNGTHVVVSYIYNKWNITTTNRIKEYGTIGTDNYDGTTEEHVLRIVKGAWVDNYANEGTKFEIHSLGRVLKGSIGKIKEAYYISNRVVKNQLTKLLYEVAPSMEIDDRIIEWLDKLGFKSVKSDEGFAYAKESDGYEHIIIYNKYNNIRLIRYYLHDDNDILFDKELELYSPEDVDALFKIIEIEI